MFFTPFPCSEKFSCFLLLCLLNLEVIYFSFMSPPSRMFVDIQWEVLQCIQGLLVSKEISEGMHKV